MGIILEDVVIAFVNIFDPEEDLDGVEKYSVQVRVHEDDKANVTRCEQAVKKAIEQGKKKLWGGKKPKFDNDPIRNGNKEYAEAVEDGRGGDFDKTLKDHIFFAAKKLPKYGKPGIVDENLQPVLDPEKFYSGVRVNLEVNPYPHKNNGVAWGLANVMYVGEGDRLDGQQSAQDAFANLAPETPAEAAGDEEAF